ncbi:MAG TPA: inositol monophosphatase [Acidimicrobiales bacterium]|nr:inositol monophosphatase [Acidimicrobiales bacterium]
MTPATTGDPGLEASLRELGDELARRLRVAFAGRKRLGVRRKASAHDLVSDADREIEAYVRAFVHARYPEDAFLGEESGGQLASGVRRCWVVDPVDGTMNFVHGMAWAASSVGVLVEGSPLAGIVVAPFSGDVYLCAGAGAELGGEPLSVALGADLRGEIVLLEVPSGTSPSVLGPVADAVIAAGGSPRTMGSGALALALVASGVVHAVVHAGPSVWDVAAGVALVEQAGGTVRSALGPYRLGQPGPLVAASAPAAELLAAALARCDQVAGLDR